MVAAAFHSLLKTMGNGCCLPVCLMKSGGSKKDGLFPALFFALISTVHRSISTLICVNNYISTRFNNTDMKNLIFRVHPVLVVLVDALLVYELGKEFITDIRKRHEKKSQSPDSELATDES